MVKSVSIPSSDKRIQLLFCITDMMLPKLWAQSVFKNKFKNKSLDNWLSWNYLKVDPLDISVSHLLHSWGTEEVLGSYWRGGTVFFTKTLDFKNVPISLTAICSLKRKLLFHSAWCLGRLWPLGANSRIPKCIWVLFKHIKGKTFRVRWFPFA